MMNLRYHLNIKGIWRIGRRACPPKLQSKEGQVSCIELTMGLIALFLLLCGILRIFVWFNQCLVERQEAYSSSRKTMSTDYYTPPELRIFQY